MSTSLRPDRPAAAGPRALRTPRVPKTPTTPREIVTAAVMHGALALIGAVAIAMIAMLLFWIVASGGSGSAPEALRSGVLVVLAACHGGLRIDGAEVTLVPLGLTVLVAMPCWRAGLALGGSVPSGLSLVRRVRLLAAAAAAFAVAAGLLALIVRVGSVQARPLTTGVGAFVLFAVCAAIPFGRSTARQRHPLEGPLVSVIIVRAALAALAVLVGAAAVVGGGALALSAGTARTLSEQVGGGGLGGLPLAVLGALCVPNAVVAALAYLAGPGFAIGAGSTVTAGGAAVGAVPAFPLLAALPADHGASPLVVVIMVAAPLGAGAAIVRLLWLRLPYARPLALVLGSAGAALLCGAAVSILAALAGGGLGSGRLSDLGPPALLTGAVVAGEVGLAAALALAVLGGWTLRGRSRPVAAPDNALHDASDDNALDGDASIDR
ncbi:MAG: hypothetical protein JWN61_806 [Pseudonocardiales bacterium]|nr:hypothetical protein [Pseudonocardiales bacterium]